jgi:hypothetical protein
MTTYFGMQMKTRLAPAVAACLAILAASCAGETRPNVARVPAGAFDSNGDNDVAAINLSSWALASSARTQQRPDVAARSLAAVDYLAGELDYSPRWNYMSPLTKVQMLQARKEVREILGVAPDAPSQAVVTGLLTAANALQTGNRAAALLSLSPPTFTKPPEQTLALLSSLPYLPIANVATQHASIESTQQDGPI